VKLSEIKPNGKNPRSINNQNAERLAKSIEEFPRMMELRPIVVDDDSVILGGNMRYFALKKLGYKDIPDNWVVKASDLTAAQKREFVIKDNSGFGEWNWDLLANEWDDLPLADWGVDVPGFGIDEIEAPELRDGDREPYIQMTFTLHDSQAETLNDAMRKAKEEGGGKSAVNENGNGNALYFIAERFLNG